MTTLLAISPDDLLNSYLKPWALMFNEIVFFKVSIFGAELPLIVAWLFFGALFFTIYFKGINIRGFFHALALVRGDYSNPKEKGEVTHFQALATAISGTVGLGNLGGVAVAVSVGGPGATFWMILAGFLGMSSKFVECTLGVKYRKFFLDKSTAGGPMYYLSQGFEKKGWPKLGKGLGFFYALAIFVACFGLGNMFQSNQAYSLLVQVTGAEASFFNDRGWLVGILLATLVGAVIIGGIKRIATVAEFVVPFMAGTYILLAIYILGVNYDKIGETFLEIFTRAWEPLGIVGGFFGTMIAGFQRATLSNEAGIGSASIAHSAVKTDEPLTEGFVSLLEPFIDTVVICTITALVINITIYSPETPMKEFTGIELTSMAFGSALTYGPYFLTVAVFLFAFSTIIAWFYYGLQGWMYLVGHRENTDIFFKITFLVFVVVGCMVELPVVLAFGDALFFVLAIPNIFGLILMAPEVSQDLKSYQARVKSGEIINYRKLSKQNFDA